MAKKRRLLVGLGNPGPEYSHTRHNVGFLVIDEVARIARIELDTHKWNAMSGWGSYRSSSFGAAKPMTFMNLSGDAVGPMLRKNHIDVRDLLVIVDDVHLPFGTIRIRPKGGSGGHNGLESLIDELGGGHFARLRIGVGGEYQTGGQSDYVLSDFSAEEKEKLPEVIERAAKASLTFITNGVNVAMNRYNKREEESN